MEEWREKLVVEAKTWIGTPYVPKARLKGVGVDCGGLLYELYQPFFGPFKPYPKYSPDWANHSDKAYYLDFIMPMCQKKDVPEPGDFTLWHLGKHYSHAGILLDNGKYIHAWGRLRDGRVTVSHPRVMNQMAKLYSHEFPPLHFEPKRV